MMGEDPKPIRKVIGRLNNNNNNNNFIVIMNIVQEKKENSLDEC